MAEFFAFFAMGGHGAYLWPAWILCLLLVIANAWWIKRKRRQARDIVRSRQAGK